MPERAKEIPGDAKRVINLGIVESGRATTPPVLEPTDGRGLPALAQGRRLVTGARYP
jgi:hypothetical protein